MEEVKGVKTFPGKVISYRQLEQKIILSLETGAISITALTPGIFRVRYAPTGEFSPRRSWSVAQPDEEWPQASFELKPGPDNLILKTSLAVVEITFDPCRLSFNTAAGEILCREGPEDGIQTGPNGNIICYKASPPAEGFFGFGERTSLLNKRGRRYQNWNRDPVDTSFDHGPGADNLYQSHPFFMALRPGVGGYGLFLNNTYRTLFDMDWMREGKYSFQITGGELDYYFIYGPEPAAILERFSLITGRTPLPPRWALGYQQCRWSYKNEEVIQNLAREFRERALPCDTLVLDIDYMAAFRVFTWNRNTFPDPLEMSTELMEKGFKLITIIDPGVKHDPTENYPVFNEGLEKGYFIRNAAGEPFTGYVWPGLSVFPDFVKPEVREWWGNLHQKLLSTGVKGVWNDMNEPAMNDRPFGEIGGRLKEIPPETLQGPESELTNHAETHNLYGLLMSRATYEGLARLRPQERPFVLSRSGFSGIQKYAAAWMGDNWSLWEHLEMSMPQLCGMGLSGVPFVGVDIGGFWGGGSPELFARWIQLGAFYPFSRGHSADQTPQKEPWIWGKETEDITRKYLELRYRFMPYLYTAFWQHTVQGVPVFRPLFFNFWQDPAALDISDQVMVGDHLMLAPVYRPATISRPVYLPPEPWFRWWDGKLLQEGEGQTILEAAPPDTMPLFVRGGSVLPLGPIIQFAGEKNLDPLTLEVFIDEKGSASGQLYEDDGLSFEYREGNFCLNSYRAEATQGKIKVTASREGSFGPPSRKVEIICHHPDGAIFRPTLFPDTGTWEIEL